MASPASRRRSRLTSGSATLSPSSRWTPAPNPQANRRPRRRPHRRRQLPNPAITPGASSCKATLRSAGAGRHHRPQTLASTETFTDVVDMGANSQAIAILLTGNMAAETIDFKAYSCDSDGNNAAAITGRACHPAGRPRHQQRRQTSRHQPARHRPSGQWQTARQVRFRHWRRQRRPGRRHGAGHAAPGRRQRGRPRQRRRNRLTPDPW